MAQPQGKLPKSKLVACDLGMIRIYESNIPPIDGGTVYALPGGGYHWRGKNYRSLIALVTTACADGGKVYALPGGGYRWRGKNYGSLMELIMAYTYGNYDD